MKNVNLIVACNKQGLIGDGDKIPWSHKDDLKRFFQHTNNQAVVVGVKTIIGIAKNYKSSSTLLKNRDIYVIGVPKFDNLQQEVLDLLDKQGCLYDKHKIKTFNKNLGARLIIDEIQPLLKSNQKIFVMGGASIYEMFIPVCSEMYVTIISGDIEFPLNPVFLPIEFIKNIIPNCKKDIAFCIENGIMASYYYLNFDESKMKEY